MPRETDAADSLGEGGSPEADRHLAENFGMSVRQVREFDPQTLDVTRACKFLGLPLKRFDLLATQPGARARWVESVARQKKDLIELFPQASKEMKEMLEAIRKFALRKCLTPDSPARVDGGGPGANGSTRQRGVRTALLAGGGALAVALLAGAVVAGLMTAGGGPGKQATAPAGGGAARQGPFGSGAEVSEAPIKPAAAANPPATEPAPAPPPPADPFQVKSVWVEGNPRRVLTVTERNGEKFSATFEIGDRIERVVTGTIKDGKLSWLAKDVRAIRGGVGGDNHGMLGSDKAGDKIDFAWRGDNGANGTFTLRLSKGK